MNTEPESTASGAPVDPANASGTDGTVRRELPVPEEIFHLGTIAEPDYVDAFTLTVPGTGNWSPEQWARALFGDVPDLIELFLWRGLLHLRLFRRVSPDHVAGWKIADGGERWIRLEASSWFLTAHLVVQVSEEKMSLATFMQYDRRLGAYVWTPIAAVHRRLAPGLLRDGYRALQTKLK